MEFNYYSYADDLFAKVIQQQPAVYIFDNYYDLKIAIENYNPQPLQQQSLFLTLTEFKERLFGSEQLLVKEEKLPLLLYSVLTKAEKTELRIENYQDIYQFSSRFFAYFKLCLDYKIKQLTDLTDWQKARIDRLEKIKIRYQNLLYSLGYVDQLILQEKMNLNIDFLTEYQQLNFFNIVNFTPYFKDLLNQLAGNFKIKLHLQLYPEDFSENDLTLKQITLPAIKQPKIEIKKNNSKLKSLAAFLTELEISSQEVELMEVGSKVEAANILSQKVDCKNSKNCHSTELYAFLQSLYSLYQSGQNDTELLIDLQLLNDLLSQSIARNWLGFTAEDFQILQELIREDYYYLDRSIIQKKLPNLKPLVKILVKLKQIGSINDLIRFLLQIAADLFQQESKDILEKFSDTLLELQSIERLGIIDDWQLYYADQGGGLFSLFLNHFAFKKITLSDNPAAVDFFPSELAPQTKRKKLLINNCIQAEFKTGSAGLYFLSEKQLQANNIHLQQKKQLTKKYKFLRHLFNADQVIIFTVENESESITPAVILEELALEYELSFVPSTLHKFTEKEVLAKFFNFKLKPALKNQDLVSFKKDLSAAQVDFGRQFNFSYYKYKYFKDCYHRFYLEYLAKLPTELEIKPALSLAVLGIIAHQVFADLLNYAKQQQIYPAQISGNIRQKLIISAIRKNKLKLDKDYLTFYEQIIAQTLNSSFLHFSKLLQKYLPVDFEDILVEWPEWDYQRQQYFSSQKVDFYLSGRIDLLIFSPTDYFIIDFKTGSGDQKQLDFYSLMLRQNYAENLPAQSRKAIYNIFAEAFEHSYHNQEKEDQLGSELQILTEKLFAVGKYERIYKSRCQSCPYQEICRVEVTADEKSY